MPVRRFTIEEYHRLIEDHYFVADEQFELIDGYITEKTSRNPPHDAAVNRARRRIERALPSGWIVRIQSAITTADSEPEPDVAVARGEDDDYVARHPGPADLALVVEVANTTLATDRGPKLAAYARAGIAVHWIVNLDEARLEVFTAPDVQTSAYAKAEILKVGDSITILLDGNISQPIPVGELLP
jgi:Uma2 family endonuclease